MNIYELAQYVNQDIDDTFSVEEIARWFNRAIASYNLIPPITRYPFITMDNDSTLADEFDNTDTAFDLDTGDDEVGAYGDYPLSKTFMLAVMAPYIASAVKGQEASIGEKQYYMQEFMVNARQLKSISNIPKVYLLNQDNNDLDMYQLGENVYLTDFTTSPMAGEWSTGSAYKEVIFHRKDDTLYKVVDDSKVDEDWDAIIDAQEG
jgi:hypothetical protein